MKLSFREYQMRIVCLMIVFSVVLFAQNKGERRQQAMKMAKSYEVKPMAKPSWAERGDKPLFRVAWLSDTHITSSAQAETVKKALAFARGRKADFAIFSGDNVSYTEGKFSNINPPSARKHAWFKAFLRANAGMPCKVICGDNWHDGFIDVFGSRNFAFDAKGFHFIFASLDARGRGGEGCSIFDKSTFDWIEADLASNSGKPTLFIMHETIWPPTFLEAPKVENLLVSKGNVLAAMGGHLHLDLDLKHRSFRQLVCPALGNSHRPGFKIMSFYSDAIIMESCEYDSAAGTFFMADKWQKIDVPENLRPSSGGALDIRSTNEIKPVPVRRDDSLATRSNEIYNGLLGFAVSLGLGGLLGK